MDKLIFKFFCHVLFFLLLALVTILLGCKAAATGRIVYEIGKNPEVYFCPRDDCGKILENNIKSANSSVYCAFYDLNLRNVINALAVKSRIIDVKIVIDDSNNKGQIKGDGVRMDNEKALMHNKFCVIDDSIVLTGSFNPTDNDNNYNNNNLVVIHSQILPKNYKDEFDELWSLKFGEGNNVKHPVLYLNDIKIENFFCPDDKCSMRIVDLIKNAKSSIYFMSFAFTNEEIADVLIRKDDIEIRGIFDAQQSFNKYSQFKRLNEFGVNVKKDTSKYKMHHKVFIIDNETVVTGSFNPTLSADTKNDENLIVIHDKKIAESFLDEFDMLWNE